MITKYLKSQTNLVLENKYQKGCRNLYIFVLPKFMAFKLSYILDGIVGCSPVAMVTKSDFQFEFETFWPQHVQHHHCINRKKSGAKISA